jgi:hypothetical protein
MWLNPQFCLVAVIVEWFSFSSVSLFDNSKHTPASQDFWDFWSVEMEGIWGLIGYHLQM